MSSQQSSSFVDRLPSRNVSFSHGKVMNVSELVDKFLLDETSLSQDTGLKSVHKMSVRVTGVVVFHSITNRYVCLADPPQLYEKQHLGSSSSIMVRNNNSPTNKGETTNRVNPIHRTPSKVKSTIIRNKNKGDIKKFLVYKKKDGNGSNNMIPNKRKLVSTNSVIGRSINIFRNNNFSNKKSKREIQQDHPEKMIVVDISKIYIHEKITKGDIFMVIGEVTHLHSQNYEKKIACSTKKLSPTKRNAPSDQINYTRNSNKSFGFELRSDMDLRKALLVINNRIERSKLTTDEDHHYNSEENRNTRNNGSFVQARIFKNRNGIDLNLYSEAISLRKKYYQD